MDLFALIVAFVVVMAGAAVIAVVAGRQVAPVAPDPALIAREAGQAAAEQSGAVMQQHFTFRPAATGMTEERLIRGLHPYIAYRMKLERLRKFDLTRLPSSDEDVYLFDELDAQRALEMQRRPLCLFGHTHVPTVFSMAERVLASLTPREARSEVVMEGNTRYLINCGAVGQPRDNDPRAAYGIVDAERRTIETLRVPYDVSGAQAKIVEAGLPGVLAQRLAVGR